MAARSCKCCKQIPTVNRCRNYRSQDWTPFFTGSQPRSNLRSIIYYILCPGELREYCWSVGNTDMPQKRIIKFPCGGCGGESVADVILCVSCNNWWHRQCDGVSPKEFQFLASNDVVDYLCRCCRSTGDGFDYAAGLQRLASVTGDVTTLAIAAKTEAIYLQKEPLKVSNCLLPQLT